MKKQEIILFLKLQKKLKVRQRIIFETVEDTASTVDNYLPFFLTDRPNTREVYKTYIYFMDLSRFKTDYQETDDEEDKVDPKDFLVVFESQ